MNLEVSSLELSLDKRRHHIAIMSTVGDKCVIFVLDFGRARSWSRFRNEYEGTEENADSNE